MARCNMELASWRPLVSSSLVLAATAAHVASSVDEDSLWVSLTTENPGTFCLLAKGSLEVVLASRLTVSGWGAGILLLALQGASFSSERRLK